MEGVRRLDAAVGVLDAAARVGLELAGDPRWARLPPSGAADRAHRRAALRDRLPGAVGAAGLAAGGRPAARGPAAAGRGHPRRFAARVGVGDRPARGAAAVGGGQRGAPGDRRGQRLRRASGDRLAGLGAAARLRPAARDNRVRGTRAGTGVAGLVRRRRRPRPAGRARGVPAVRVRPHHVRVARRPDPGQRRPLLPPLHDGRAARRAAAGRPGSSVAGGALRATAGSPGPALAARPVRGGRARRGGRGARARVAAARRLRPPGQPPRSRPSAARTPPRAPSSIASSR